jgi:hypothetical protein
LKRNVGWKETSVEKIPVRATIFSALSIIPYLAGFIVFVLSKMDYKQVWFDSLG